MASDAPATHGSSSSHESNPSAAHDSFSTSDVVSPVKNESSKKPRRPRPLNATNVEAVDIQGRRHPPVRATKTALMNNSRSLSESAKPARRSKKTGVSGTGGGVINGAAGSPVTSGSQKPRFFEKPRQSRTASLRVPDGMSQPGSTIVDNSSLHNFDFNGQDDDHFDEQFGAPSPKDTFSTISPTRAEGEVILYSSHTLYP